MTHEPQSAHGRSLLDFFMTVRNQVRAAAFGVVGLDFAAVLTTAAALGLSSPWLAELLAPVERALLIYHNRSEDSPDADS